MITYILPLRIVSESNSREHWAKKAARHKLQQKVVRSQVDCKGISLPCSITLTRLAPRSLDDDNLQMAFKWVRDELSDLILPDAVPVYIDKKGKLKALKGRADNDPRIAWHYAQEKSKAYAIRIDIS